MIPANRIRYMYAMGAVVLFIMEVLIALVVKNPIIRGYLGDFLVVILLYYILRIFMPFKPAWLPVPVFAFAVLVEVLQYYHIVDLLHLSGSTFFRILIGGTFDVFDIVSYFAGCLLCFVSFYFMKQYIKHKEDEGGDGKRSYDPDTERPAIKCSICNGEQVAGFISVGSGQFHEDMLIRSESDLAEFKKKYGISGDIEKIY